MGDRLYQPAVPGVARDQRRSRLAAFTDPVAGIQTQPALSFSGAVASMAFGRQHRPDPALEKLVGLRPRRRGPEDTRHDQPDGGREGKSRKSWYLRFHAVRYREEGSKSNPEETARTRCLAPRRAAKGFSMLDVSGPARTRANCPSTIADTGSPGTRREGRGSGPCDRRGNFRTSITSSRANALSCRWWSGSGTRGCRRCGLPRGSTPTFCRGSPRAISRVGRRRHSS